MIQKLPHIFFLLVVFFCSTEGYAQLQLFDFFNGSEIQGRTQLVETSDGGWITIMMQSQPIGSIRHDIVLTKFDECGEPVSTSAYHFPEVWQLSLQHSYKDTDSTFWVLILGNPPTGDRNGVIVHFDEGGSMLNNLVISNSQGYYPYTMGRNANNELVVFGNVQSPGIGSSLIVLNENLSIKSGKRIEGFGSWGTFLPTEDGGYICRSGITYYKLDINFEAVWVKNIPTYYATHTPVELPDGYVFSVHTYSSNPDQNFLLKFDKTNGDIIWQSPNLLTLGPTKIKSLANGNIMQIAKGFPDDILSGHVLFSEIDPMTGLVLRQRAFNPDLTLGFAGEDFIERENGSFVFVGRNQSGGLGPIIQSLTTPSFSLLCGDYQYAMMEDAVAITTNEINLNTVDLTIQSRTISFEERDSQISRERICFENILSPPFMPIDSMMCVGDSILIDLRFIEDEIIWNDGSNARVRNVGAPGNYSVTVTRCNDSMTSDINLTVKDCSCTTFLPNTFTPNNDGVNDQVTLFSNCNIESFEMQVFDRWGGVVFQTNNAQSGWTGESQNGDLQNGVYILVIQYTVEENGVMAPKLIQKEVLLLR